MPRKLRSLYSAESEVSSPQHNQDPEDEGRRELGLDTNNLIEASDEEDGIELELDDGYQY